MHNGSAVQKLRHSSNPQPPALRRQASSNTSVLVLKERSPDCILQPPTPGKRWEPALSCSWTGFSFSALGGVASAPGGMVSVREAWPPALGGGDTTGRRGLCAGRCGLCTGRCGLGASRRGLWGRSPGLCERRGLCTESCGLCARRRGLSTGGGALYGEAWPLHFSGPHCAGVQSGCSVTYPFLRRQEDSGTREAQAAAVRGFSQERSGLFPNM